MEGESVMMRIRDWSEFVGLLVGSVAVTADWSAKFVDTPVRDS